MSRSSIRNPRPLRIAFMTTVGVNVGDEFIREGICSFFDDLLGIGGYDAYYVDKHDLATLQRSVYDEPELLADKFRDADVIVQAGAPVYWNNGRFKSYNADWYRPLWQERIFQLGQSKLILNLGAGAGQKSEDDLDTLLSDPELSGFSSQAGRACAWTSVRDPLADEYLSRIGVEHEILPCPAFHAARRIARHGSPAPPRPWLAVNLMKLAGHYRLKPETSAAQWRATIDALLPKLRQRHRLLFVAHDPIEADFQRELAREGEMVFYSRDFRDYLSLYSRVSGIVANRVHGAICVAGFGRPAVIVGNDCRIGIARPIGIPARDSAQATAQWICQALDEQFDAGETVFRQRIAERDSSARLYALRLGRLLERFVALPAAA